MANITFIQPQAWMYSGLYFLAGAARAAGHRCTVCVSDRLEVIDAHLAAERPDVVGLSVMTGMHVRALELARHVRERFGVPILLGGPHPTYTPEVVEEPGVDAICRGDGEQPLVAVLDAIERGRAWDDVPGLWVKTPGGVIVRNPIGPMVADLDELPRCDFGIYDHVPAVRRTTIAHFYVGRGCHFACGYCHNAHWDELFGGLGPKVRWASPGRIVEEVRELLRHVPRVRFILLGAETWGLDLAFFDEALTRFAEAFDVPFGLNMRPELVREPQVAVLRRTRCYCVAFGVESGSLRIRRDLLGRPYRDEVPLRAARLLHEAGIPFRTFNILGHPTETREELFATVSLNQRMRTPFPYSTVLVPYPGTPIHALCVERDLLKDELRRGEYPTTILGLPGVESDHEELVTNLQCFFQTLVLHPWLEPLIRPLLELPPNPLFRAWFLLQYGVQAIRLERRSLLDMAVSGARNVAYMTPSRRERRDAAARLKGRLAARLLRWRGRRSEADDAVLAVS